MKILGRENLAAYLKQKRIDAGFTQLELAKKLGYSSAQFISNWERRLASPPISALGKLCALLDLDRNKVIDLYLDVTRMRINKAFKKLLPEKFWNVANSLAKIR